MKNKALLGLIVLFVSVSSVSAQVLNEIGSMMDFLFFGLSATASFVVYLKAAFFVMLFAILNAGMQKVPNFNEGTGKRAGTIVAFVIALISAILVPGDLLLFVFDQYHALLVYVFALLPVIVAFLLNHRVFKGDDTFNCVMRGLIYFLMGIYTLALIGKVDTLGTEVYENLSSVLSIGAIVAVFAGIWTLINCMSLGTTGKSVWENLTGKKKEKPKEGEKKKEGGDKEKDDDEGDDDEDTPGHPTHLNIKVIDYEVAKAVTDGNTSESEKIKELLKKDYKGIKDAQVLVGMGGQQRIQGITNDEGKVSIDVPRTIQFQVAAQAQGYQQGSHTLPSDAILVAKDHHMNIIVVLKKGSGPPGTGVALIKVVDHATVQSVLDSSKNAAEKANDIFKDTVQGLEGANVQIRINGRTIVGKTKENGVMVVQGIPVETGFKVSAATEGYQEAQHVLPETDEVKIPQDDSDGVLVVVALKKRGPGPGPVDEWLPVIDEVNVEQNELKGHIAIPLRR